MIHGLGTHLHLPDVEFHCIEFFDVDLAGQVVQFHREKRRGHLAFENFAETGVRAVVAKNADFVFVVIRGKKAMPSNRIPEPASSTMISPSARTSTQLVLPP
jgi:hypothetical protein